MSSIMRRIREIHKFSKSDIIVIFLLSLIITISSFLFLIFSESETSTWYALQLTNPMMQFTGIVLSMPATIMMYIFHYTGIDNGGGDDLGSYIWGIFSSPLLTFIIWFSIFYILAKISSVLLKGKYSFLKHGISIFIIILLASPYIFYSSSTNQVNACLSGKLDYTFQMGQLGGVQMSPAQEGPMDCFKDIVQTRLGSKVSDQTVEANYCNNLSDTALVDGGKNGSTLSYRTFCENNLENHHVTLQSVIPQSALPGTPITIYGSNFSRNTVTVLLHDPVSKLSAILWSGISQNDNSISFNLNSLLSNSSCSDLWQQLGDCSTFINVPPGKYKIEIKYSPMFSTIQMTPPLDFEVLSDTPGQSVSTNTGAMTQILLPKKPIVPSNMVFNPVHIDNNLVQVIGHDGPVIVGTSTITLSASKAASAKTGFSWINIVMTTFVPWQALTFNVDLTNNQEAQSLLSVLWDGKAIGDVDGRITVNGQVGPFLFPVPAGSQMAHVLGLRLDSFTQGTTSMTISNIQMGSIPK